jgi:hypothetical protein
MGPKCQEWFLYKRKERVFDTEKIQGECHVLPEGETGLM